jgi:hypothetical protein
MFNCAGLAIDTPTKEIFAGHKQNPTLKVLILVSANGLVINPVQHTILCEP